MFHAPFTHAALAAVATLEHPIVFFDGVCVFCNNSVDMLLRADKRELLRFASLQGETAKALLPPLPHDPMQWSITYLDEKGIHEESDAVLAICRRLGGAWKWLSWAAIVPKPLRDALYRVIVHNRYRWFGQRASCRLPTPQERHRFLP